MTNSYSQTGFVKTQKSAAQIVAEFKKSQYVWHATPQQLGCEAITKNEPKTETESPGMYLSTTAPINFLILLDGELRIFGLEDAPKPALMKFESSDIKFGRIPASIRTQGLVAMNRWLVEKATIGNAYITPAVELGKPVIEAVIPPYSKIVKVSSKEFTILNGRKIPIELWRIQK